jgi:predicted negative regulator of RcsB-dependent stress response
VRAETRHQLKEDRFSRATLHAAEATAHWSAEHKSKLVVVLLVLLLAIAAAVGGWYYTGQQDQKASADLGEALRTLDTPVRPADAPAQPDSPSFASSAERATAAHKQFQAIVDGYPRTHAGRFARYFLALTAESVGDHAAAERDLKEVASSSDRELAALANFALASVYRNTNRTKDAVDLYKKLIDKPTTTVGKLTSQMELAATYQASGQNPAAKQIYQEVQKQNPASQAAQAASAKLQELK